MAGINGAAVKALREKDGQSGQDFAARLGISPSYLSEIEKGEKGNLRRNPALIKRIAGALNVPVSAIEKRGDADGKEAVAS
jgi:transcriptional regulator with XRE-family HTH domain